MSRMQQMFAIFVKKESQLFCFFINFNMWLISIDRVTIIYKHHELENKGIVFKARWFVRPDINTGATII